MPDAARIAVPRCAVCGVRGARRNLIGLYAKPCFICEKSGYKAGQIDGAS